MQETKTILVAPLNWGLGHATRCIPIVDALLRDGFKVLLGSDGPALLLLRKQFPDLDFIELPAYGIEYAKKGANLKWKMLLHSPKLISAIHAERRVIKKLVNAGSLCGIISDNRLGLSHPKIPAVFITHQLQVLSGSTTKLTSALHRRYIKRFDTCWVPDYEGPQNLSGKLGHPKNLDFPVTYIGLLSGLPIRPKVSAGRADTARLQNKKSEIIYDIMVLLSGPEPQRSKLDEILMHELEYYKGKVLFVRGIVEEEQKVNIHGTIKIINFLQAEDLESAINSSSLIICRSGYTTIMDLAKMGKKAFFIPTPGQAEQEYLAKRLKKLGVAPYSSQDAFSLKKLSKVSRYSGFKGSALGDTHRAFDLRGLFGLFKGERKL